MKAPFQHSIPEPWDSKYTNAVEKQGVETKERYENIMRKESFKIVFSDYYFYYNPEDLYDPQNQKFKILPCSHDKLQNGSSQLITKQESSITIENPISQRIEKIKSSYINNTIDQNNYNYDSKLNKAKNLSNSNSANSILKQYKVSGASSYVINNSVQANNSGLSIDNKSFPKGSQGSNNSTSTSNRNTLRKES